jgi:hypothetical protein
LGLINCLNMLDDLFDEKIVVILEKDLKCKIVKSCVTRQVTIIFPTSLSSLM